MIVSVIIPCYNSEKYISSTLASVLNQTFPLVEIVCVDNGSTDNTLQILTEFASKYPNIHIYTQPIKGAANARNMGIEHSTGEYLQFLDSDDEIIPTKIEKQVELLQSQQLDVVVSDRAVYNETLETCLEKWSFVKILENPLRVAISDIIITGNPLYRKSAVVNVSGYKSDLRVAQDWDFHIRLFLSTDKIGYLSGYFLKSRKLVNSLSSDWIEVSFAAASVLKNLGQNLLDREIDRDMAAYIKIIRIYLDNAIVTNDIQEKEQYIVEIKKWSRFLKPSNALSLMNKVLYKIVGLEVFVRIKRFFKSKKT